MHVDLLECFSTMLIGDGAERATLYRG